jgi:serine/threonine protein phosphatase PrpC
MEGLKVSALAVQAFVEAVRESSLAELSDPAARDVWLRAWTKSLHADAFARFKGGMATFCGAVILPPSADGADWKLFTLNVGDSQVWKLTGDGRCLGVTPDAPPNNANVEGHNPIRVVGVAPKGDFCLMDVEEFPLPKEGPCWILAGSDGFFSKKKGKDELSIFSTGDLRDVCLDPGVQFQELPARAIRRSLDNARKLGAAEMMDNSTVAMLGFRVPATDLDAPAASAAPAPPPQGAAPAAARRPPDPPASSGGEAGRRAQGAQTTAPVGRTRPTAAEDRGSGKRLAAVAAGALLLGLLIGGGMCGRRTAPATPKHEARTSPTTTAAAKTAADLPKVKIPGSIPDKGRCSYCLAHWERLPDGENPFHWAKDCPHRDKWATRP